MRIFGSITSRARRSGVVPAAALATVLALPLVPITASAAAAPSAVPATVPAAPAAPAAPSDADFGSSLADAGLTDVEIIETHRVHEHAGSAIVRARKPA